MMVSNFSTESYDKQLMNLMIISNFSMNLMMVSNFSTESYDGKQLQN